jgi:hypothetical protein
MTKTFRTILMLSLAAGLVPMACAQNNPANPGGTPQSDTNDEEDATPSLPPGI